MTDLIPTRYAIGDDDFDPDLGRRLVISLDGVVQAQVIAYDIEAGTVTRYRTNDHGEVMLDTDAACLMTQVVRGQVVVTMMPASD